MPTICMFRGIKIYINLRDHMPPHFHATYGEVGRNYIEAHHTKPVSEMKEGEVTRVEDLAMVCANCHRMLHRRKPLLKPMDLKKLLK